MRQDSLYCAQSLICLYPLSVRKSPSPSSPAPAPSDLAQPSHSHLHLSDGELATFRQFLKDQSTDNPTPLNYAEPHSPAPHSTSAPLDGNGDCASDEDEEYSTERWKECKAYQKRVKKGKSNNSRERLEPLQQSLGPWKNVRLTSLRSAKNLLACVADGDGGAQEMLKWLKSIIQDGSNRRDRALTHIAQFQGAICPTALVSHHGYPLGFQDQNKAGTLC